jgi:RNA polymerase sigma factor (sigma-70 family)
MNSVPGESIEPSESEVVAATPNRAEQVLRLFLSHHGRLVNFLRARVGSKQAAEDLAQKAYEELLSVEREGATNFYAAYLYKTAKNLALDMLKHEKRARHLNVMAAYERPRAAPSPEPLWVAHERLELLNRALQQLPARIRMVFMLKYDEELTYKQIIARLMAEDVRINVRTAKRYVERALVHCERFIAAAEEIRRAP